MSPTVLASAFPTVRVRFKRCPECGDVTLLSAPICSCCDRAFVTTSRYVRKAHYVQGVPSLIPSPYLYDGANDFAVLSQKPATKVQDRQSYNALAIFAAFAGLGWAGMMLNGQKTKGLAVLVAFAAWLVCAAIVARESPVLLLFTCVAGAGGYLVGVLDVICISNRLRKNEDVSEWDWF
jgi:hypothetical protein